MPVPEPTPPSSRLHSALSRNTGYLLSRVGRFTNRHFAKRLETLGLTTRAWGALNVLDAESPLSQQELGRLIGMDPSSVVSTLDELERQGLVERRRHPSDRRAHALYMTDDGRNALARGRALARSAQAELLEPLSPQERTILHDLLLRLAERTDAGDDEVRPGRPPPG